MPRPGHQGLCWRPHCRFQRLSRLVLSGHVVLTTGLGLTLEQVQGWSPPSLLKPKLTLNLMAQQRSRRATSPDGYARRLLRGRQWQRSQPRPASRSLPFKRPQCSNPPPNATSTPTWSPASRSVYPAWTVSFLRTPLRNWYEEKPASARCLTSTNNASWTRTSSASSRAETAR